MTNISTFVNYGSWKIVFGPEVETWSDFQLQTFAQDQTDGAAACAMDLAISVDKRWGQRYVYFFFIREKHQEWHRLKVCGHRCPLASFSKVERNPVATVDDRFLFRCSAWPCIIRLFGTRAIRRYPNSGWPKVSGFFTCCEGGNGINHINQDSRFDLKIFKRYLMGFKA